METKTEFLYLSEPDMINAGVLDPVWCVNVCEDIFKLLAEGDYLMGGSNRNSHGLGVVFPKETKFPNMPIAGPDRRFVAMPGYLGGKFDVCGNKWYGSNHANASKGLPRSVLTVLLNDKDTGEPLSLMSANLLSAARTGAVPGVAARHLARKDSEVIAVIGCGPINKSCLTSIMMQMSNIKKVVCHDLFLDKAETLAKWASEEYGVEGVAVESVEDSFKTADVITIAVSRLKPLHFEDTWIKRGATVLISGPTKADESFWLNSTIVYDNTKLHEAYVEEAIASGDKQQAYNGVIGGPLYNLIDDGKLQALSESTSIGEIILKDKTGRTNDKERITFIACGMSVFDLGWGYEMYKSAQEKGLGQKLLLWDEPYLK